MLLVLRTLLAVAASGVATCAIAAEAGGAPAPSEAVFICQIVALLVVGRALSEVCHRLQQPAVMGQLLAGLVLGPSILGAIWPDGQKMLFPDGAGQKAMLEGVSQLGILLLLLLTGMETDLALVRKVGKAAISVSLTGVAVPFACGFMLGEFLPDSVLPHPEQRLVTSLFLGTALSISSVKIVAMVVREMDFLRRNVGQIIVASAIIDDTIGWVIIAITFSLASHGSIDIVAIGRTLLGTTLFLAASFTVGRRLVFLLIRWANDELDSEAALITTILAIMGLLALATHAIGVHTVLGAFVAGILVGQSPILTRQIDEQLRSLIAGLFAPVFFGLAGLHADLTILRDGSLLLVTIALIAIASAGKFLGAFTGGMIGGLRPAESLALGCGMNARGSTEVIVATIGLSIGALSNDLFTMIVAMAVLTTLVMPPTLRWALARLPVEADEKKRLAREEFEARGFVTQMERLMVVADPTPKGRFAARIAGLIAGTRGMPVTVVPRAGHDCPDEMPAKDLAETVRTTVAATQTRMPDTPISPETAVTDTPMRDDPQAAVAEASRKGFDFLLVGIEQTAKSQGGFNTEITKIIDEFDGPFAIVAARGNHLANPDSAPLRILVPVNGTDVARRGAEVALTIARAGDAKVTALFVTDPAEAARRRRVTRLRRSDDAVLREIGDIAKQEGVTLQTAMRIDLSPEDAILRQARLGDYDMIVLGAARRPGDFLSLGAVADALLEASERSIVFVSTNNGG